MTSKRKRKTSGNTYRVLVGIDYQGADGKRRAEPGEVVDDLSYSSAQSLLRRGVIEGVTLEEGDEGDGVHAQ